LANKRGYFVNSAGEPSGFAVVATSAKEAKKIAYKSGKICVDSSDVEWIDIRVRWIRIQMLAHYPLEWSRTNVMGFYVAFIAS